jgi:hypothetical protein
MFETIAAMPIEGPNPRGTGLAPAEIAPRQRAALCPARRTVALMLMLAGCGGRVETPAPVTVVEGAIVAHPSIDQSFIAYYTQPTRLPHGPFSGSLEVMPLPSGPPIALGDGAFNANFDRSDGTLFFLQQPTVDPTTSAYTGSFSIWTPKLDAPFKVSTGFVPRSASVADHSAVLFLDTTTPALTASGQVKLLRASECAGTTCPVTTLADNATLTATRMSLDGRYAAYDTQASVGGVDTRDIFLVSVADGKTTHVASTAMPPQVAARSYQLSAFSPDGSLLATLTTLGGSPLQLQVISTATGAPVAWAAPPGMLYTNVVFADPGTLLVGVFDAAGAHVHRTTATGESQLLDATQFFVFDSPPGAGRYLFFSTGPVMTNAPYDLQMLDLSAPTAAPVSLASSTFGGIHLSEDVSTLWLVDQYDPTTSVGTLVTASLPGGQLSKVADGVYGGSANFDWDTSRLFYFGAATLPSQVPNATGAPLYRWSEGTVQQVEPDCLRWAVATSPPTLYVTADSPLRIYRTPLP